jgi:ribulose-5-phosphate 4-epimerase/fuculose-1-phosphate aldolase
MNAQLAAVADRSLEGQVSDAEWETRVNLAACYRLVAHYGMTDLTALHISARLPDAPEHFLLNPYGLLFEEITASNLVKLDMEGNILDETPYRLNMAGHCIHSAVLGARPDVACVVHTHTPAGIAISAQKGGLLMLSQTALRFYGDIAYHDYEGIATDLAERQRLARDLGENCALVLRNHGLLVAGRTVAEAFTLVSELERACVSQIQAQSGGADLIVVSQDVAEHTAKQYRAHYHNQPAGETGWPAFLRKMDKLDSSYRT